MIPSFSINAESCPDCGHQHAGAEVGGICVGCPCERTQAPKAKRKPSTTPTQRCMAECRKRGWTAAIAEKWVRFPPPGHHVDLFGVIDIVAIAPPSDELLGAGAIIGIQASPGTRHAAHRDKILAEPRAKLWVEAGGRLELWSWSKRGDRGARKLWTLRVEAFTAESWGVA